MEHVDDLFGALREATHGARDAGVWAHLCEAVTAAHDGARERLFLTWWPYVARAAATWPRALRICPDLWFDAGRCDPRLLDLGYCGPDLLRWCRWDAEASWWVVSLPVPVLSEPDFEVCIASPTGRRDVLGNRTLQRLRHVVSRILELESIAVTELLARGIGVPGRRGGPGSWNVSEFGFADPSAQSLILVCHDATWGTGGHAYGDWSVCVERGAVRWIEEGALRRGVARL